MTVCAALNCKNSSRKSVKLYKFPANPERRAQWVQNIRRDNFVPSASTRLCEVNFIISLNYFITKV